MLDSIQNWRSQTALDFVSAAEKVRKESNILKLNQTAGHEIQKIMCQYQVFPILLECFFW